jgi:hypothetical protein
MNLPPLLTFNYRRDTFSLTYQRSLPYGANNDILDYDRPWIPRKPNVS